MVEAIGIGIIGVGGIGAIHVRALAHLAPQVRLVAYSGSDPHGVAAEHFPGAVRVQASDVASRAGVDIVAICSPTDSHATTALAALGLGKHVLVEKPLATTVAEAERVARAAAERSLMVSMVSQRRFEPEYQYLHRALREGRLGRVRLASTHVHWHRDAEYYRAAPWRTSMVCGGGSLMNQGVHNVDLLQWLCGPVDSVTAQTGNTAQEMDAEDTTVATVRFGSGALGLISTSTAVPPGDPATVHVHTESGTVSLGQGDVLRWEVPLPPPPAEGAAAAGSGARTPLAIGYSGHLRQWRDLIRAITSGTPPLVDAVAAVATVRLLCAIYEAAGTGRRVSLAEPR